MLIAFLGVFRVVQEGKYSKNSTFVNWNKNESILDSEFVFSVFVVFVENGILDSFKSLIHSLINYLMFLFGVSVNKTILISYSTAFNTRIVRQKVQQQFGKKEQVVSGT